MSFEFSDSLLTSFTPQQSFGICLNIANKGDFRLIGFDQTRLEIDARATLARIGTQWIPPRIQIGVAAHPSGSAIRLRSKAIPHSPASLIKSPSESIVKRFMTELKVLITSQALVDHHRDIIQSDLEVAILGIEQGWYPDPSNTQQKRFWDGTRWTDQVGPLP